jgi:choline dehydrogenase-like flavoprotein
MCTSPKELKVLIDNMKKYDRWSRYSWTSQTILGYGDYMDELNNDEEYLTNSGFHHLGGTRMGDSAINSVVNSDLKVHQINNLFVAGSSVFPTGGHANPTLTIVQLSLRLSV